MVICNAYYLEKRKGVNIEENSKMLETGIKMMQSDMIWNIIKSTRIKVKNMNKRQKILIVDDSKTVFMKEDLLPVMGDNQMIQDLPSAFIRVLEEQNAWKI